MSAFSHSWEIFAMFFMRYLCSQGGISWYFGWAQPWSLWHTKKLNLFLHTHNPFDCENMNYEKSSQILYHVIPRGKFCHPWNAILATDFDMWPTLAARNSVFQHAWVSGTRILDHTCSCEYLGTISRLETGALANWCLCTILTRTWPGDAMDYCCDSFITS